MASNYTDASDSLTTVFVLTSVDARQGHKIRILSTTSIVFFLLFEAQ